LKSTGFWVATQCISGKPRRFEGTFLFHHQRKIVSEERNQEGPQRVLLSAWFYLDYLLGLLFKLEDGGDMFLRNVGGDTIQTTRLLIVTTLKTSIPLVLGFYPFRFYSYIQNWTIYKSNLYGKLHTRCLLINLNLHKFPLPRLLSSAPQPTYYVESGN
jgi:hypothetical protein